MDHFLYAHNPLKPAGPTGLQGYIIDTVKGTWIAVEFQVMKEIMGSDTPTPRVIKNKRHYLSISKSCGDAKEDIKSITRATRWYDSWLQKRRVSVDLSVSFAPPEKP